MAVTFQHVPHHLGSNVVLAEWDQLTELDTNPPPLIEPGFTDGTVELLQIYSGAPTVRVEWSLSLTSEASQFYAPATDPQGTTISLTSAPAGKAILETGFLLRPRIIAGVGSVRIRIKVNRPGSR